MNKVRSLMLATVLSGISSPAWSADVLKYGPAPSWITPLPLPKDPAKTEAPVAILMQDQQITFEPGKLIVYSESAIRIQSATGLGAGNISLPWRPETDTVTVNKLQILRGGETIDVLAAGQTFNVLRRETNLEQATLDGMLTANIQPEGLQEGDVIVLALTVEHVDPVTKNHVEASFGEWNLVQYQLGRVRVNWPDSVKLRFRSAGGLPALKQSKRDGRNIAELSLTNIEPQIAPKSAPPRFQIGRVIEASDFSTWSELSDLMVPLYREAAIIPAQGPLRAELEKIRSASKDPKKRAQDALKLVQDRIRYVALLMGQGGYVPASAETTWSRRFGDCKAKTAMLLALLRELGIEADSILVTAFAGDALPERLPMLGLFNHVLVRANIGGKTYWLDGTRSGDLSLDIIPDPSFRWGLPLVAGAKLVPITERSLTIPEVDTRVQIDASNGIYADAAFKAERIIRGDFARISNVSLSGMSPTQLEEFKRKYWKNVYDDVTLKSATHSFDAAKSELRLAMTGTGKIDWDDGWYSVPHSGLAFDPDFERPEGPNREASFEVGHPNFSTSSVEIRLPKNFYSGQSKLPSPVSEAVAGTEYKRSIRVENDILYLDRSEKSLTQEIAYKDALAAAPRLKALSDDDVYLRVPDAYVATPADIEARSAEKLASWGDFFDRGWMFMNNGKLDEAAADFTESHKLNPTAIWPLSNRAMVHATQGKWDLAAKDVTAAEAIQADNAVILRVKGMIAQNAGDFAGAVDAFSKSLVKDPNSRFALLQRANLYRVQADYDKALADTDQLLKFGDDGPEVRLLRANLFVLRGEKDSARREADLLMAMQPDTYAFVTAAKIYDTTGDSGKSTGAFDRALAIKPEAFIYINRAQTRPKGELQRKLADLDAALKLEPANLDALLVKAQILRDDRRYVDALAVYEDVAKAMTPNPDWLRSEKAVLLAKAGRTADSKKLFAEARAEADGAMALNNLCWSKATANIELNSALDDCRAALKLEPDAGAFLDSLGMVLLRLGRLDEAMAAYDKAIDSRTGAASFMGRAIVRARKGDAVGAEADRASAAKLSTRIEEQFAGYDLRLSDEVSQATKEKTE